MLWNVFGLAVKVRTLSVESGGKPRTVTPCKIKMYRVMLGNSVCTQGGAGPTHMSNSIIESWVSMDHLENILPGRFPAYHSWQNIHSSGKDIGLSDSHPIHVTASIHCLCEFTCSIKSHLISISFHISPVLHLSKVKYASRNLHANVLFCVIVHPLYYAHRSSLKKSVNF